MVLAELFPLSDIKSLRQFDVIKVMPNRLQPAFSQSKSTSETRRQAN